MRPVASIFVVRGAFNIMKVAVRWDLWVCPLIGIMCTIYYASLSFELPTFELLNIFSFTTSLA